VKDVKTIGLIGAGHIGSQLARLAVKNGYQVVISNSRGPETLSTLVAELGPKARAATAAEAAKAGDIVVVTVPLKNYPQVPVEPLAGKIVIDTNNYYPQRVEGGKGVQSHLRRGPHRPWTAGRHEESSRVGDRGRRPGSQGGRGSPDRPVRVRNLGRGSAEGGMAHPARHAGLWSAPHGGRAAQGPRLGEAIRRAIAGLSMPRGMRAVRRRSGDWLWRVPKDERVDLPGAGR